MGIRLEFDRIPVTLARTGKSHSGLYRAIEQGLWTPPVKIGAKSAAHPRHEVDAIMAAELNGQTPDQIRALVRDLIAQRKSFMSASSAS
jgi:prophage regulatory protein